MMFTLEETCRGRSDSPVTKRQACFPTGFSGPEGGVVVVPLNCTVDFSYICLFYEEY